MNFEKTETDEKVHIHASATGTDILNFFEYALWAVVIAWVAAGFIFK